MSDEYTQADFVRERSDYPDAPIFVARREANGRLSVFCQYCARRHYHGVDYGHRSAHCDKERSPYRETGYFLVGPGLDQ